MVDKMGKDICFFQSSYFLAILFTIFVTVTPISTTLAEGQAFGEDLTVDERKQIQNDLIWTSTFYGVVDGEFDADTFAAIRNWKLIREYETSDYLSKDEIKELADKAQKNRDNFGWKPYTHAKNLYSVNYASNVLRTIKEEDIERIEFINDKDLMTMMISLINDCSYSRFLETYDRVTTYVQHSDDFFSEINDEEFVVRQTLNNAVTYMKSEVVGNICVSLVLTVYGADTVPAFINSIINATANSFVVNHEAVLRYGIDK